MKTIRERILDQLKLMLECKTLIFLEQDEFYWHYKAEPVNYRVFKFFSGLIDTKYHFELQKSTEDSDKWENIGTIIVNWEIDEEDKNFWRDPEPIRPSSLNGFRIRLHKAYEITGNIHEAFYLISKEVYDQSLEIVTWYDDNEGEKFSETVLANNTLKLFQAFDVFKVDLELNKSLKEDIKSMKMSKLTTC